MSAHRDHLPQLDADVFLADGGFETTMIFDEGLDLPEFAAFTLLARPEGIAATRRYFETYAAIAQRAGVGLVIETATWRASADWGALLGYSADELAEANRAAVALAEAVRTAHQTSSTPIVVSGCIGPRGDGYDPGTIMSADEAHAYHRAQVETLADTTADMIGAITMTSIPEAIGVARAARDADMPVAISFTVETDGRLPSGEPLAEAVLTTDAATDGYPAYYMVNCAHPTHFDAVLTPGSGWMQRVRGIRANASTMSHAELDEAEELDDGDPVDLAARYAQLRRDHPQLTVLGGCCGTDHRHVEAIAGACVTAGV